jgi:hypothetical protein
MRLPRSHTLSLAVRCDGSHVVPQHQLAAQVCGPTAGAATAPHRQEASGCWASGQRRIRCLSSRSAENVIKIPRQGCRPAHHSAFSVESTLPAALLQLCCCCLLGGLRCLLLAAAVAAASRRRRRAAAARVRAHQLIRCRRRGCAGCLLLAPAVSCRASGTAVHSRCATTGAQQTWGAAPKLPGPWAYVRSRTPRKVLRLAPPACCLVLCAVLSPPSVQRGRDRDRELQRASPPPPHSSQLGGAVGTPAQV